MEVGNVNSKHFVLTLKVRIECCTRTAGSLCPLFKIFVPVCNYEILQVKSVLDPCEDENDDIQEEDVSLGADSVRRDESESDSEVKF